MMVRLVFALPMRDLRRYPGPCSGDCDFFDSTTYLFLTRFWNWRKLCPGADLFDALICDVAKLLLHHSVRQPEDAS